MLCGHLYKVENKRTEGSMNRKLISIHGFKTICKRFRDAQHIEISNYAMEYNYFQYANGVKTPLVERMELFFKCDIGDMKREPLPDGLNQPRLPITPKISFTDDISHLILPVEKNRESKVKTNNLAYSLGKKFFISTCSRHKETLYLTKSHVPLCCSCRYVDHQIEIQAAAERFLSSSRQTA